MTCEKSSVRGLWSYVFYSTFSISVELTASITDGAFRISVRSKYTQDTSEVKIFLEFLEGVEKNEPNPQIGHDGYKSRL